MTGELVLLTGGSGHLGFRALVYALEAGYHVRAAVRSQSKAQAILNAPSIKALGPGKKLEFVVVPDILANGAYGEALKDVKKVVHIASPIAFPTDDYDRDLIQPAIQGTMGILKSAIKVPSVERIVITSSGVAIMTWEDFFANETDRIFDDSDTVPDPAGPYGHHFQAYCASKTLALNATTRFVETEKPAFDVINILPGFIIGKNELVTDAKDILNGTNGAAFAQILGHKAEGPTPYVTVHVDDVAKVHILALDPKIQGNQNFAAVYGHPDDAAWGDAVDIVKKNYPGLVEDGTLPADQIAPSKRVRFVGNRTEKVMGIKFQDYEAQVKSVTEHYLELIGKAA
ncbi:hypothetical protein MMC12_001218 [Toensbergia leucococca]|nr:hypothetical protein [Toensbergia leucococca]